MKHTIIHGVIASLSLVALAGCGGSSQDTSDARLLADGEACAAAWNATTAYATAGTKVSRNGRNYTNAFWTQGQDPATSSGPAGSGQPWITGYLCGGTTPTPAPTPTPTPAPTPTPTPAPTPTPTPAPTGSVTLYQDCNYTGWAASFGVGSYRLADITARGGRNDDASSIRVPSGYKVTLYRDDNFTGASVTITGDNSCFTGISFNDAASSMVISTASTPTPTPTPTPTSSLVAALPNSGTFHPVCSPTVVIDLQDPNGFTAFTSRASLNDLKAAIQQLARNDCSVLYKTAAEPPNRPATLNIVIKAMSGVAYAAGNTITLSSTYIQGQSDPVKETLGVFAHEVAHVYQNNDSDAAHVDGFGGIIEGVADFVRYKDGYKTLANRRKGGTWKDGYDTTAFFIDWLDRTYPGFAYRLNQGLSSKDGKQWTTNFFIDQTGQTVDQLWTRYQASF